MAAEQFGFPLMIKPAHEGRKYWDEARLNQPKIWHQLFSLARQFDGDILAETFSRARVHLRDSWAIGSARHWFEHASCF